MSLKVDGSITTCVAYGVIFNSIKYFLKHIICVLYHDCYSSIISYFIYDIIRYYRLLFRTVVTFLFLYRDVITAT